MLNELIIFQNEIEIRLSINNLTFEVSFVDELTSSFTIKSGDLDITQEINLMSYPNPDDA